MINGYRRIKRIGKGGMGEVFLVYDPICNRRIALKCVRTNVPHPEILKKRFLKEARITARLVHPGVIPVYSIVDDSERAYYTMPYVEGRTLKQLFKQVWGKPEKLWKQELKEKMSLNELTRVFYTICRTMEYVHAKGVLHRDLKPDNILLGLFGEVIILDWGVAALDTDIPREDSLEESFPYLGEKTAIGKITGTPNYMPPERLRGERANQQGDVYALGVILYQILTLQFPFNRTMRTIKKFKSHEFSDFPVSPEEVAPFREIPSELSKIAVKALADDPNIRYSSVKEMIFDLMAYMQGTPVWYLKSRLIVDRRDCWEVNENVLFTGHLALTGVRNEYNWQGIIISKEVFAPDVKFETHLTFSSLVSGLGFLFSVPGSSERKNLSEGYCLRLEHRDDGLHVSLFKNSIEIIQSGPFVIQLSDYHSITIEKRNNKLTLYVDDRALFDCYSYFPGRGGHVGLLYKNLELTDGEIKVFECSHNLNVSCLAIPEAFLIDKNYDKALSLYKQIAVSFPGREESREAMFQAGLTLLEKGKNSNSKQIFDESYAEALNIFSSLHTVSGGPLEYLGKAIVYRMSEEYEEEVKCLELGIRRYAEHPLVSRLKEHLIYRAHEAAETSRFAAYLLLLTIWKLDLGRIGCRSLIEDLLKYWETPPLEDKGALFIPLSLSYRLSSYNGLSFFFDKALSCADTVSSKDAFYSFCALGGNPKENQDSFGSFISKNCSVFVKDEAFFNVLSFIACNDFAQAGKLLREGGFKTADFVRLINLIVERVFLTNSDYSIINLLEEVEQYFSEDDLKLQIIPNKIFIYLTQKRSSESFSLLDSYSLEELADDSSVLFTLYGCWLALAEDRESALIHFSGVSECLFPKSFMLLAYYAVQGELFSEENLFRSERLVLYRYQMLYHRCLQEDSIVDKVKRKWKTLNSSWN